MSKIADKIKKILLSFHEWNQKRWFVWSCLYTLTGVWFSLILAFFGESLGFIKIIDTHKQFTVKGILLTILAVGWTFFCLVAQRYYEYYNSKLDVYEPSSGEKLLNTVNKSIIEVCRQKKTIMLRKIEWMKTGKGNIAQDPPCRQLELLSSELARCLSTLLTQKDYNIRKEDINVRIFYNFPQEHDDVWKVADNLSSSGSLSTSELMREGTTFNYALNSREQIVFWNSKEDARKANCYVPVERDEYELDKSLRGSIACYKITESVGDNKYIQAIVCISTYSKRFVKAKEQEKINNACDNIRHFILDVFARRISIELIALYTLLLENKKNNNVN